MTKHDLSVEVAKLYPQYSGREVEIMVNAVFASLTAALVRDEGIELRGFGSFGVKQHQAREGRNPRTGRLVAVAAKRVVWFKVAKELRARVDDQRGRIGIVGWPAAVTRRGRPPLHRATTVPTLHWCPCLLCIRQKAKRR
jgi:integration host factor subunit beta